jgi:hypothetical protein
MWYLLTCLAGQASILVIQYVMLRNAGPPRGYDGDYTQH